MSERQRHLRLAQDCREVAAENPGGAHESYYREQAEWHEECAADPEHECPWCEDDDA